MNYGIIVQFSKEGSMNTDVHRIKEVRIGQQNNRKWCP